jgi:two-component system nitrate/nitrite response regulator NarL
LHLVPPLPPRPIAAGTDPSYAWRGVEFEGRERPIQMTAATVIGTTDSRLSAVSGAAEGFEADGSRTRVAVVSNVRLYREGLSALLGRIGEFDLVASVAGPHEAAARVRDGNVDVVVLDVGTGNVAAARQLLAVAPGARVVVLAETEAPEDVIALAEAGVLGYVTRSSSLDQLEATIESVADNKMFCDPWIATVLVRRVQELAADRQDPSHRLTAREAGILQLIADGLSNREIASRLHIELTTVKNHVHNILEKLDAKTRAEAVALVGLGRGVVSVWES